MRDTDCRGALNPKLSPPCSDEDPVVRLLINFADAVVSRRLKNELVVCILTHIVEYNSHHPRRGASSPLGLLSTRVLPYSVRKIKKIIRSFDRAVEKSVQQLI